MPVRLIKTTTCIACLGALALAAPISGAAQTTQRVPVRWEHRLDLFGFSGLRVIQAGDERADWKLQTTVGTSSRFRIDGSWTPRRAGGRFVVHARASTLERRRFYGFGNTTDASRATDYYRLDQFQAEVGATVRGEMPGGSWWSVGPVLSWSRTGATTGDRDDAPDGAVLQLLRPYGAGSFRRVGLRGETHIRLTGSRPEDGSWPTGLVVDGRVEASPEVLDLTSPMLSAAIQLRSSMALPLGARLMTRASVSKIFGAVPFQAAAYLGGRHSLRGFQRRRYAGDAALSGSAEVWGPGIAVTLPFTRPIRVGPVGFADLGRVYNRGRSPGGWHLGAGGGVWIEDVRSARTASLVLAHGAAGPRIHVAFGLPLLR